MLIFSNIKIKIIIYKLNNQHLIKIEIVTFYEYKIKDFRKNSDLTSILVGYFRKNINLACIKS